METGSERTFRRIGGDVGESAWIWMWCESVRDRRVSYAGEVVAVGIK